MVSQQALNLKRFIKAPVLSKKAHQWHHDVQIKHRDVSLKTPEEQEALNHWPRAQGCITCALMLLANSRHALFLVMLCYSAM